MMLARLRQLGRDESGAALTEFVMVLPVFLMIFAGIGYLGSFERASTKTWGAAYRDTWRQAIPVQKGEGAGHHREHSAGGARGVADLGTYEIHNRDEAARSKTNDAEARAYAGTQQNGDFGESGRRVESAQAVIELPEIDNQVGTSASPAIQESEVGTNLFDDAAKMARATGARFGVAVGMAERTHQVGPYSMNMRAHFNGLVAPVGAPEEVTAAAAASGIEGLGPYDDLMGIAYEQPLPQESVRVDPLIEATAP